MAAKHHWRKLGIALRIASNIQVLVKNKKKRWWLPPWVADPGCRVAGGMGEWREHAVWECPSPPWGGEAWASPKGVCIKTLRWSQGGSLESAEQSVREAAVRWHFRRLGKGQEQMQVAHGDERGHHPCQLPSWELCIWDLITVGTCKQVTV